MLKLLIFNMEIKEEIFKVIVKPNFRKNELIGFDKDRNAYIIRIKEKAKDNKANIELIKFLSKVLGKGVKIKSGIKSKEKLIETYK